MFKDLKKKKVNPLEVPGVEPSDKVSDSEKKPKMPGSMAELLGLKKEENQKEQQTDNSSEKEPRKKEKLYSNEKAKEVSTQFREKIKAANQMIKTKSQIDFRTIATDEKGEAIIMNAVMSGMYMPNKDIVDKIANGQTPKMDNLNDDEVKELPDRFKAGVYKPENLMVSLKIITPPTAETKYLTNLEITVPLAELLNQDIHNFLSKFYNHVLFAAAQHQKQKSTESSQKGETPLVVPKNPRAKQDEKPRDLFHLSDQDNAPTASLSVDKPEKIGFFTTSGALHGQVNLAALENQSIVPRERTDHSE